MNETHAHGMNNLRQHYEFKVKRRVADSHWWKVRKVLKDANLELTERNLDHYLEIKKYSPRYHANIVKISQKLKELSGFIGSKSSLTGNQFIYYLSSQKITATSSTINRWFQPVSGFRKDRVYDLKELSIVAIPAFVYQIKQEVSNV